MPLELATRMVEQRGGHALCRLGRMEIHVDGRMIGYATIVDDGVRFLAITAAFAAHEAPRRFQ